MSLDIDFVCDGCGHPVCEHNITHNVVRMWEEAGCYEALYQSDGKVAGDIVPDLTRAVADMKANPDKYRAMDSPNGWGTYDHALPWLIEVLENAEAHPGLKINVSA